MEKKIAKNCELPIVKLNLQNTEAPKSGEGIRLAIYQGQGQVGDQQAIQHNLTNLRERAAKVAKYGAQILVLPELFLCGYNIPLENVKNVVMTQEQVLNKIAPIAIKNNLALVCPYAEVSEGEYFEAALLVDNQGNKLGNYRKNHLWGPGEKQKWHYPYVKNPEDAYIIHKVNGINIGLLICYEAEFPELSRILALKGVQMILVPTASDLGLLDNGKWTDRPCLDISKTIIPTNAYQNGVFVAYANHALYEFQSDGTTLSTIYLGNSSIADPYGHVMVAADNLETLLIADCYPNLYCGTYPDGQGNYIIDRRPPLYEQLTSMTATFPDGSTLEYPEDPNIAQPIRK